MSEQTPPTEPSTGKLTPEQQALIDEFRKSLSGSTVEKSTPGTEPDDDYNPDYPSDPQLARKAWLVMGYLIFGGVIKPPKLACVPRSLEASDQLDELYHIYSQCCGALEAIE